VENAPKPQTFRHLDEHWGVFDIDDLPGWRLGDVQRQPKDVRAGFADVDEAGGYKRILKPVQPELTNPLPIQFATFVADHGDLQPIPDSGLSDQIDHLAARSRLGEYEAPKLSPGECSLLVEVHPIQIFFQRELSSS
jgi:hypothetical protein